MFGLRKRRKRISFLNIFNEFYKLDLKNKTIKNWEVSPELTTRQLKEPRTEIRLHFTDNTALVLNIPNCDIKVTIEDNN